MTKQLLRTTALLFAGLAAFTASAGPPAATPLPVAQLEAFADEIAERHGLERNALRALLTDARHTPRVLERIRRPAEALEWRRYRPIFLTPERIRTGADFWAKHADTVADVVDRYRVEPEILIAILGVESNYGESAGDHRVLDALATLAFDYPPRAAFFRQELEAFLLLAHELDIDPRRPTGSYAGAMGKPQFIASSYRAYAVPYDGEDRPADLFHNVGDALASIANYLARHGWQLGEPITAPVQARGERWRGTTAPLNRPVSPVRSAAEWRAFGIERPDPIAAHQPAALIELQGAEGPERWLTFGNFYALTRYNHSALYAMAVYQLAEAIRKEFES